MGQGRGQRPHSRRRLPRVAVMLAGWLNPPPLRRAIDVPLLALPLGPRGTLLDAWMAAFARVRSIEQVRVVVNSEQDAARIRAVHESHRRAGSRPQLEIFPEPHSWRGPAGLLRDVIGDLADHEAILMCETSCLPPRALRPLTELLKDESVDGAVGVTEALRPAGIYAFSVRAIRIAPGVGYFDLKEQLLPALRDRNWIVRPATLSQPNGRVRDLDGYLHAVRLTLANSGEAAIQRIDPHASVSGSAILDGPCIVEAGAVIEDGAVVHESVIMRGATIGGGAVVSQSVIGPLGQVRPREHVVRELRSAAENGIHRPVSRQRKAQVVG